MKTLKLVLKKVWYDMIASGEKKEEYRELTEYWEKRIIEYIEGTQCASRPKCDAVQFYCGYAKNRPTMTWTIECIRVGQGKPEWGAVPGKDYFVIKIGERL